MEKFEKGRMLAVQCREKKLSRVQKSLAEVEREEETRLGLVQDGRKVEINWRKK